MERTFALLKPDLVRRNLIGEAISEIEKKFKIVGMYLFDLDEEIAEVFYEEHKEKKFFKQMISFITSDPVVALCLEGENAVEEFRNLIGATNPTEAKDGTLRKRFGISIDENSFHGSSDLEAAKRELDIFFAEDEENETIE